MSQKKIDILERALAREKAARKQAEKILEVKSADLYYLTQELSTANSNLENAVQEKTSQLKGIFENIIDAYVVMDLQGTVLKMNEPAIEMLGYDSKIENIKLFHIVHPNDRGKTLDGFMELSEKGILKNFQINILTKSNELKIVQVNSSVVFDKNKKPIAAQGIVRDITIEKRYKESIEAERQKYSSIIANMNLGLLEVDIKDEILFANQSFLVMSGYSEEELVGHIAKDIFVSGESKKVINSENSDRLDGNSNSYELLVDTKHKKERNWLISGAPQYNINGEITGSIGIHLDITEFRNLEK